MDISDTSIAADVINQGGVILCPTDTVWGLSASALDNEALEKIIAIKQRPDHKSFIVLFDSFEMAEQYFNEIPAATSSFIVESDRPTTVIIENGKKLAHLVYGQNASVAFRIVQNDFCIALIRELGYPIVSTSPNISGATTPVSFDEISNEIKDKVDYTAPTSINASHRSNPSRIVKWTGDSFEVIRD